MSRQIAHKTYNIHHVAGSFAVPGHCSSPSAALHRKNNNNFSGTTSIMQEAEVVALPRIIVKRWKDAGIDVLVNNAGMGRNDASLFDGNTASWVEMVSTNTLGVCMCTREAVQVRLQQTVAKCHVLCCDA